MPTITLTDIYAGLSGVEMVQDVFDLGCGASITRRYAHLMGPFILAFEKPKEPGGHHPSPWKSVLGGNSYEIFAELYVPEQAKGHSSWTALQALSLSLRLGISPSIDIPIISTHSFEELRNAPDKTGHIIPYEARQKLFPLQSELREINSENVDWVSKNWRKTHLLMENSKEFKLAADSLLIGQYIQNKSLIIAALWSGLEAIFSPSTSELRFRVSSLIASYLHERGEERLRAQKRIAKLYDKRSSAIHGSGNFDDGDILDTFHLTRCVIVRIIEAGYIPSKDQLDEMMFG